MYFDCIIIGGGPAGLTAALYLKRGGKSVAVFEKMTVGGQMAVTPRIENYPGFENIDGWSLAEKMEGQVKTAGAQILSGEIVKVDLAEKKVHTAIEVYDCGAIIIATGALSKKLGLKNEDELLGSGVSYCATCDGNFFKGKDVMVVGNTPRAKADVKYLSPICRKVYWAAGEETVSEENVEVVAGFPAELIGKPLSAVAVRDGVKEKTFEVSGLFAAIGFMPQSYLFKGQVSMNENGFILTDEHMSTDVKGVYAIGDVRKKPMKQIVTAASDGATSAGAVSRYLASAKKI